jgi:hypothetical protein
MMTSNIIKNRGVQLFAALAAVILTVNLVTFTTSKVAFTESYPAIVCPADSENEDSFISLASSKVSIRKSGTSTMAFKESRNNRLAGGVEATIIDSQAITPISWQTRPGIWAGAVTCLAPITSQWFVGGSADVTSKGRLTLVNSGLGRALVGVSVFTESGSQIEQVIPVKANSVKSVRLSYLTPGSRALVINVVSQSGRVNAFLIDERGRGLQSLGGDAVNSISTPSRSLVIPAIPHTSSRASNQQHILRLMVPGDVAAEIKANIISADESFAPAGIDGRLIAPGKVIDLPLNVLTSSPRFALELTADRPIVAAVFSKTLASGKSDFLWSTPVPELQPSAYSITGTSPLLVFAGEEISVDLEIGASKGKIFKVELRGSGLLTYQVGAKARTVTVKKSSSDTYGAALINSASGSGYAPLLPGTTLTRSSIPQSDIRVLIP